jgi:site-specific DNA-methyltransferase (adenine-specific)
MILAGDCIEQMAAMDADSIDACVTDPPYELGFMGRKWDRSGIAFRPETWAAVLRVLKPGAALVAFGAPRNYHRLACAIEDAGFEVRDCLMWIFGQGFPKHRSALKPAYEPIILARKPGPLGLLNIDGCRVATDDNLNGGAYADVGARSTLSGDERVGAAAGMFQPGKSTGREFEQPAGRWPANIVHDGSEEVLAGFPDARSSHGGGNRAAGDSIFGLGRDGGRSEQYHDAGSAARFFYCAKASKRDRAGSKHPTVKPVDLMRWLVRLVTPPGGLILDPFAGSGTTGQAAAEEGFRAILIEQEPEYLADIARRLNDTTPPLLRSA